MNGKLPINESLINKIVVNLGVSKNWLKNGNDEGDVHQARLAYMAELAGKIGEYNAVLTHWIQLRQGHLDLHIESFALQDVFAILSKSACLNTFSVKRFLM